MTSRLGGFNISNSNVYLNVYDLHENNDVWYPWGLGFYHSGVQIGREEYTFASSAGIFTHEPKAAPGAKFRESIDMGKFTGTSRDLETIISNLRSKFHGNAYHLLNNNCNCFATELVQRLTGREIPAYVNRMANLGSFCSCLFPEDSANSAPVDQSSGNYSSSSSGNAGSVYSMGTRLNGSSGGKKAMSTSSSFTSSTGRKLGRS